MAEQTFTRREVNRAFRQFKDLVRDLENAHHRVWGDAFLRLMEHCETNPVMCVVTKPLRENTSVNVEQWLADVGFEQKERHLCSYRLPANEDDQAALLYQFFLRLHDSKTFFQDVFQFCEKAYNKGKVAEIVEVFNRELVSKFERVVGYRLDEVLEDIGGQEVIPWQAVQVFHFQDHSMTIQGNIQGSNVATGGSNISESTATYNNNADLAAALKALKPLIQEVAANQREAVESALEMLVAATEKDIPVAQIAEAVETVDKASPTLGQKLKEIVGRIGTSLAAAGIFQVFKSHYGIH